MGKVGKGVECSIHNCTDRAVKSVSLKSIPSNVGFQFKSGGRNIYLCEKHYKAVKKAIKKKIDLERERWKAV
ncbi:MAG: hypothetical protein QXP91_05195 [Candidatus Methanomethylicia archaeon]